MKNHVYQFALRRPDDKKKCFVIETDLVYADEKLSAEVLKEISEKHKCDIKVTYLGVLLPTKKEESISVDYHSKDMIQAYLDAWQIKKTEEFKYGFETELGI